MSKKICKIVSLILGVIVMFSSVFAFPTQAATNDFSMKSFDKGYVTFLFDDNRMPFTQECFNIFSGYDMPMCCDVVAGRIKDDQTVIDLLKKIQSAGGEIFSHTYTHNAITSTNNNTKEDFEREFGDSYRLLTSLGFDIHGVIEAGNGGGEKTANYELIETFTRKYYKYSNAYGVSPQYNLNRTWLKGKSLSAVKSLVDDAVNNKKWITLWAHDFSEFSSSDMSQLLAYIGSKGENKVEVVTWKYIYDKFANYTGPQVPSKEAIESVCTAHGHDLKSPVLYKEATCEKGPVMKGECKRCGKTETNQLQTGATGHKFGKFVSDNNATCYELATKTAKCTVKGCNATKTEIDFDSEWKHNLKTVVIKEATAKTEGKAERRCTLCDYVEEVVIPKGKDADDVVSSEIQKNDASSSIESEDQGSSLVGSDLSTIGGKSNSSSKVVLIVILALSVVAIGVAAFFIIKKFKS